MVVINVRLGGLRLTSKVYWPDGYGCCAVQPQYLSNGSDEETRLQRRDTLAARYESPRVS